MSGWPTGSPTPLEPLAAPVLRGPRYGGRPRSSDVIVGHDSPITGLEELRGRSWAYNEPASHSGHTLTLSSLVRLGAAGTVDAAAIDAQVLAIELRDHPALADRLRFIGTFGPSTIQPVVAASHLPAELTDQTRELLVTLADDPAARPLFDYGLIDRFTPIADAAYDDIRAMVATIETAGWTSLTQTATSRRVHP